jgi:hypothetical protein
MKKLKNGWSKAYFDDQGHNFPPINDTLREIMFC